MVAEQLAISPDAYDSLADAPAFAPTPISRSRMSLTADVPFLSRLHPIAFVRPLTDVSVSTLTGGCGLAIIHGARAPDLAALAIGCSVLAAADLARQGGYGARVRVDLAATVGAIGRAMSVAAIVALALGLTVHPHVFLVAAASMAAGLIVSRAAGATVVSRAGRAARRPTRVAVVGDTLAGKMVLQELAARSPADCVAVGYITTASPVATAGAERFGRFPRLGDLTHLSRALMLERIDEVVVALPSAAYADTAHTIDTCRALGVAVRLVPHDANGFVRLQPDALGEIPVMRVTTSDSGDAMPTWTKRALDVSVATIALLCCLPLLACAALAICLESRGPIFFRQERIGKDGNVFTIFKLRSMRANAEQQLTLLASQNEASGPIFKMRADPRVTRVGRILRKLSVDELPQLWNVVRGDMSLVGPRPPLAREVACYADWQRERLHATPGITCLWGVRGRSRLDFEEMVVI